MDGFWIVLAIVIMGGFVVGAINRNTQTRAALAEQDREDRLSSPEYQIQARVSLDYFQYLRELVDYKIGLTEVKIQLFNPPKWLRISKNYKTGDFLNKDYFITSDKKVYLDAKKDATDIKLVDDNEIVKMIKLDIVWYEKSIKELGSEYSEKQKENLHYIPEDLDLIKTKYELDAPLIGEDWVTTAWQMYEEKEQKLVELQRKLELLDKSNTKK